MIHQIIEEGDIVEYMESIYQSCILSMTVLVMAPGCGIDSALLESMLRGRDFPIGHSLVLSELDDFRKIAYDYRPDCVVVVTNGVSALSEVMNVVQSTSMESNLRCTIVVL